MKTTYHDMRARRAQAGIGLIELMIAAAIGLFVLLGVTYAYIGNRQSYLLNESLANMQENARVISETLSHDLRLAGASGCNRLENFQSLLSTSDAELSKQLKSGVEVVEATDTGAVAGKDGKKPELRIYGATGDGVALVNGEVSGSKITIVKDASSQQLQAGDHMLISDCEKAHVFKASAVGDTEITIIGSVQAGDDKSIYGRGAQVFPIGKELYKRFFLKKSGRKDTSGSDIISLFYDNQEVAEGVDAFRVCVGEVKGDKMAAGGFRSALGVDVEENEKVMMVQVDVVLASLNHQILRETVDYSFELCGDTAGSPSFKGVSDKRLRRMFSTSVALRNKLSYVPKLKSGT
jgi:type IV pilus assembly protein PilW